MSCEQKIFLRVLCIDVKTKLKKVQSIRTVINQAGSSCQVSRNQTSRDEVIEEEVIESWFPFRTNESEDCQQNPLLRKMESSTKFSRVIKSLMNTLVVCYDGPSQNEGEGVSLSNCELFTTKEVPAGGTYHFDSMEGDPFDLETVALIDHQCTAADLGITVTDHGDPSTSLTLLMKFHSIPTFLSDTVTHNAFATVASVTPPKIVDPICVPSREPHNHVEPQPSHSHPPCESPSSNRVVSMPVQNSVMRNGRGNNSFSCGGDIPSTTALGPMRDKLRRQQAAPRDASIQHLEPWPSVSYGRSAAPAHFHNTSVSSSGRRPPPKMDSSLYSIHSIESRQKNQSYNRQSLNQIHNQNFSSGGDDTMDEISILRRKLEDEKRKRYLAEMEVLNVYNSPPRGTKAIHHSDAGNDEPAADIDEIALREHRLLMDRLKIQRPGRSAARN